MHHWIRASGSRDDLDRGLLEALGPWFEDEWRVGDHAFITNEQFEQQVAMIEGAGLQLRLRLRDPKAAGVFLAYA